MATSALAAKRSIPPRSTRGSLPHCGVYERVIISMGRELSPTAEKRITLPAPLVRALIRARLNAADRGEGFPKFNDVMAEALQEWLEKRHPDALAAPGPGRPRKTPVKKV